GAAHRIPVVIDGFISGAAAIVACKIAPQSKDYLIASHLSAEKGHERLLNFLGLKPLLSLSMRLGEGTGAALAISLTEAAVKVLNEMATFDDAGVSKAT
ncbi:MAG TPA: nicotinate-nucleotide--dimethylbenzimidazole phosphoribosyltransferase, partial [Dehalococcoidia bacterium]|nr:nicotinate-nucleotide--dimethylbenzimidazole phosphoribosyltransferase [Dehalococcoidia bacterium]